MPITGSGSAPAEHPGSADPGPDNVVFLRGRLAAPVEVRELPSGDQLTTFRLTVPRPAPTRVTVDSLECVTLLRRVHRVVERAEPGDVLEVTGSLQRRFWRSPTGPASRYAVDVTSARRGKPARVTPGRAGDAAASRTRASG